MNNKCKLYYTLFQDERKMLMSEKLIDYLAEKCNVYVSDLSRAKTYSVILPAINDLNPYRFSAEDWSESLSYLFKESLNFEDPTTAKSYCMSKLMEKLSNNNSNQGTT